MNRKIIHLDMDSFFASIEERDDPSLRGKPVVVGALPGERGVVSTCNYEARKYGIHSAMSIKEAYTRCPHAVFMHGHYHKYEEASAKVHAIMLRYTDCVEFLSLDEGYMDVTQSERFLGDAATIAKTIQKEVFETVGTTCSVGVGYNMLSAKLASEEKKPRGFFEIPNEEVFFSLMKNRPVGILYGIGKKTVEKLRAMSIRTVADLANTNPAHLAAFGILGQEMQNAARGIDHRRVTPNAPAKSIGRETTFPKDITDLSVLQDTLLLLSRSVSDMLKESGVLCQTVTLKIKFSDMQSITRASSGHLTCHPDRIYQAAVSTLMENRPARPVRLIGISCSHLTKAGYEQLSFDTMDTFQDEKEDALDAVVSKLRHSFGKNKVITAKELLAREHIKKEYEKSE